MPSLSTKELQWAELIELGHRNFVVPGHLSIQVRENEHSGDWLVEWSSAGYTGFEYRDGLDYEQMLEVLVGLTKEGKGGIAMTVPELFINFIIFFVGVAVIATVIVGCIAAYMLIKGVNRMRHEEWEITEDMSRMKAEMRDFLEDSNEPTSRRLRKMRKRGSD